MKLSVPALAPLLPLLVGCTITITGTDDGDDEVNGDGDGDGDSTTTDTTTDTTSTDTTDDEIGTETETDTSSETEGPLEFCELEPGDAPFFNLVQGGEPLLPGGNLELVCGGQGSFMIRFDTTLGGFMPDAEVVPFTVELDVEGFNLGPNGHFAEDDENIFIGCCDFEDPYEYNSYCYYGSYFTLFPPDTIEDLTVLHQLPASLTVTMTTPEGPVEQTLDLLIWAVDDGSWSYCEYGYDSQPLPVSALPLPIE